MLPEHPLRRRHALAALALPLLPGCSAPLPVSLAAQSSPAALGVLHDSAAAHGQDALARLDDVSVRYSGTWRALVARLQPALVDPGFRDGSEERLLLRESCLAQAHRGSAGTKQVWRRTVAGGTGEVRVWYNAEEVHDAQRRDASALVADAYSLFLFGPLVLTGRWAAERTLTLELGGVETLHDRECDVVQVRCVPGLGFAASDRLALWVDRRDRLLRAVRFSLDGLEATVGAIAQVDLFDHRSLHGVQWPTRFAERLVRPAPLPVHDWTLDGLDVNRGLERAEIDTVAFTGRARAPAAALPPGPVARAAG